MPQFFVVKPDGSRLGPFDGETVNQMRLDGAIGVEDTVIDAEQSPSEPSGMSFSGPPQTSKKPNVLLWVLVGACVLCIPCGAIFAAILFPVFAQARIAAQQTSTLSNLKKVGRAVLAYQLDNDDKFPLRMDSLSETWPAIAGYAPGALPMSANPAGHDFSGNISLAGVAANTVEFPDRTYEFFDSVPWAGVEKRMVGFADSSAAKLTEPDFQAGLLNHMVRPPQ